MVHSITRNIGSTSHNSAQSDHIPTRPSGTKAPFAGRQPATVGDMEAFRKVLEGEGVSNSLPHLLQTPEGQGQYLVTNRPGESWLAGVVKERLIPLQVI